VVTVYRLTGVFCRVPDACACLRVCICVRACCAQVHAHMSPRYKSALQAAFGSAHRQALPSREPNNMFEIAVPEMCKSDTPVIHANLPDPAGVILSFTDTWLTFLYTQNNPQVVWTQ